jgi:hypothetical protein
MNSGGFIPEENEHLHGTQRFVPMKFLVFAYGENPEGVAVP